MTFPNTLAALGSSSFAKTNLAEITYKGTIDQYKALADSGRADARISSGAADMSRATREVQFIKVFCAISVRVLGKVTSVRVRMQAFRQVPASR